MYDESFTQAVEEGKDQSLSKRVYDGKDCSMVPPRWKTFGAVTYRPTPSIHPPTKKEREKMAQEEEASTAMSRHRRERRRGRRERSKGRRRSRRGSTTTSSRTRWSTSGHESTFWYNNHFANSRQDPKSKQAAWGSHLPRPHLLHRRGRLEGAKENFELALEVDNMNTHSRYWLGRMHFKYHVPGACPMIGVALLVEAANMGDADAQYELGCRMRVDASEAGPSRPNLISHFVVMGFSEEMVVKVLKENGPAFRYETEQMSRIVNELDSIHFSIKKATKLVKEHGRQVGTDRCIMAMLFLPIVMGVVAVIIVKFAGRKAYSVKEIDEMRRELVKFILDTVNEDYVKK